MNEPSTKALAIAARHTLSGGNVRALAKDIDFVAREAREQALEEAAHAAKHWPGLVVAIRALKSNASRSA